MACISSENIGQGVTSTKPNELLSLSEKLYQQVGRQRILVADDNELNQDIIVDLLQVWFTGGDSQPWTGSTEITGTARF